MKKFSGYQKGVNLGGWLSQYGEYDDSHFNSFIQESDIKTISEWGLDHVRVPVDYILLEDNDGNRNETGYRHLHDVKNWCDKYHLNMVIDLHETYGYSFDPLKKEMDREKFFHDIFLQNRFFRLWDNLSKEFENSSDHLAFELLNEVVCTTVYEQWNTILKEAIEVIRKHCPTVPIIVGGVRYNDVNAIPLLGKPTDDNIVYNFHCYEPFAFTHQKAYWVDGMTKDFNMSYPDTIKHYQEASRKFSKELGNNIDKIEGDMVSSQYFRTIFQAALDHAKENHVALYCGEYGVIDQAESKATLRWYEDIHKVFREYNIGHCIWNYKEKDFGISGEHYKTILDGILKSM